MSKFSYLSLIWSARVTILDLVDICQQSTRYVYPLTLVTGAVIQETVV